MARSRAAFLEAFPNSFAAVYGRTDSALARERNHLTAKSLYPAYPAGRVLVELFKDDDFRRIPVEELLEAFKRQRVTRFLDRRESPINRNKRIFEQCPAEAA